MDRSWDVYSKNSTDSRYDLVLLYVGPNGDPRNPNANWYICRERGKRAWWVSPGCVADTTYHMDRGPFRSRKEAEALAITLTFLRYIEELDQSG